MSTDFPSAKRLLLLSIACLVAGEASAQSLWVDPSSRGGLEFSLARAQPSQGQKLLSGAARVALSVPLGTSSLIHLELPLARFAADGPFGSESESRVGAPYVGIASADAERQVQFQFGVRFAPWSADQDLASIMGFVTDPERFESFGANFVAPRGAVQFGGRAASGLLTQARIGATALFGTGEFSGDPELMLDYGARVGSQTARGFVFADLSGRLIATASGSLGDRSMHFVGASGGLVLGGITPTAEVRLPLDGELEGLDFILRLGARVRW